MVHWRYLCWQYCTMPDYIVNYSIIWKFDYLKIIGTFSVPQTFWLIQSDLSVHNNLLSLVQKLRLTHDQNASDDQLKYTTLQTYIPWPTQIHYITNICPLANSNTLHYKLMSPGKYITMNRLFHRATLPSHNISRGLISHEILASMIYFFFL
jgi:hypothetical protein